MKNIRLLYVWATFVALLFSGCKKDDDNNEQKLKNLTLEKIAVTMKASENIAVRITDGNGGYTVASANKTIATAVIEQNNVKINAIAEGKTTLTVSDAKGKKANIAVTVINLIVPGESLTIEQGSTLTKALTFGTSYTVSSTNETIAAASITGNMLTITGVGKGKTQIIVKDTPTQKAQTFNIEVTSSFAVEKAKLTLVNGQEEVNAVIKGKDKYTLSVSPEGIVAATVEDRIVNGNPDGKNIRVKALKVGEGQVTVKDDVSGQIATFKVTITAADLTIAKTEVEMATGATVEVRINTGNPGYTVSSSPTNVVTAEVKEKTEKVAGKDDTHHYVIIKGIAAGNATITLKDSENKTITIRVVVKSKDDIFEIDSNGVVTLKSGAIAKGDIRIPDAGTSIGAGAFSGNAEITSIDFNNVTKIEKSAFQASKKLVSITGSKIQVIGRIAFALSPTLKEVTLPETITTIGQMAFMNCKKLEKITIKATVPPTVLVNAFKGISTNAILYVPKGAKSSYEGHVEWKEFKEIKEID